MLRLKIPVDGRVLNANEIRMLARYLVSPVMPKSRSKYSYATLEADHDHVHLDLKNGELTIAGCVLDDCPYARKGVEI